MSAQVSGGIATRSGVSGLADAAGSVWPGPDHLCPVAETSLRGIRAAGMPASIPASTLVVGGLEPEEEVVPMELPFPDPDFVVGFAGLPVTLATLSAGKRLARANKESLIAGGPVVNAARARGGGEIVPVDSEHSALYQALRAGESGEVRKLILTASGGPFRGRTRAELEHVTVEDALKHPTWDMGAKITIDSSTLMNKGLEVIEAHELFDADYDQVDVVVHPQSVVHGMVEFTDGATIAQLSMPDMRLPIGLALGAPARLAHAFGDIHRATPAPGGGAGRGGGARGVGGGARWLGGGGSRAGGTPWLGIAEVNGGVLEASIADGTAGNVRDVADVLEADRAARERARESVQRLAA